MAKLLRLSKMCHPKTHEYLKKKKKKKGPLFMIKCYSLVLTLLKSRKIFITIIAFNIDKS